MVQYIYFVKCPGCEDEHFDFFDEAKSFAMDCLSKKPIITQIEVCRNDFGECTDSTDLGTIWSWDDVMKDIPEEPEATVFTKDDLCSDSIDSEFDSLDNSVDYEVETPVTFEVSAIDDVPDNFRKPIPEGMTIKQLVEEMEKNEAEVECTFCNELFPKAECHYDEDEGYICPQCEKETVKCSWCGFRFDPSELRKEVNLGWLCSRCEAAIKSRGETLTFEENSYWDFLDESTDPFDHHDPDYGEEDAIDAHTNQVDKVWDARYDDAIETLNESTSADDFVELYYDNLTITLYGPQRDADDWDEKEYTDSYIYNVEKYRVEEELWDLLTDEDAKDVPGGLDTLAEDEEAWKAFIEDNLDNLVDKYHDKLLVIFEEDAKEDFQDSYSWSDYQRDAEASWADFEYDSMR